MIGLSLVSLVAFALLGLNAEQLLLGWLYFPWRTVPQVTVKWPSAIVGLVSALLLIPAIHHTATWLTTTLPPHGRSQRWTSRCTIVAAAMLLVLFAAGTSLVGAIHQAIWTATGRSTPSDQKTSQSAFGLLTSARESARQRTAATRLKLFGPGFPNYHDTMTTLPPGGTMNSRNRDRLFECLSAHR